MTVGLRTKLALAAACLLLGAGGAASAHPHVWVIAKSEVSFHTDGSVKSIRHAWTFDEMFSAFATQGLDKDGDGTLSRAELDDLAKVNVTSLKEFGYFSIGKSGNAAIEFDEPVDYWLEADKDKNLTLHFTLPLKTKAAKGNFTLDIYDPSFFVDFSFAETDPVKLAGAPAGCSPEVRRPQQTLNPSMGESFFESLSGIGKFGSPLANRITLRCK